MKSAPAWDKLGKPARDYEHTKFPFCHQPMIKTKLAERADKKPEIRGREQLRPGPSAWDKLDAITRNRWHPQVTDGFTVQEFAKRYQIDEQMARIRIHALIRTKSLKLIGKRGKSLVYDLT